MASALRTAIENCLDAVMAKDLNRTLDCFAEDAVVFDPHYPVPSMTGKAAIADGLRWSFGTIARFGFTVRTFYRAEDGHSGVVEVATAHILKGGMKLNFPQVFVFETRDGLITRLQAYTPYGPNGIGGLILGATRLSRRLKPLARRFSRSR